MSKQVAEQKLNKAAETVAAFERLVVLVNKHARRLADARETLQRIEDGKVVYATDEAQLEGFLRQERLVKQLEFCPPVASVEPALRAVCEAAVASADYVRQSSDEAFAMQACRKLHAYLLHIPGAYEGSKTVLARPSDLGERWDPRKRLNVLREHLAYKVRRLATTT